MCRVKNYILDTNVLLHDPNSLLYFHENCVLIPIEVIEEIDRFKRESTERGQNARTFSRTLDSLRAQGRLSDGVPLSTGGKLKVVFQKPGENGQVVVGSKAVDTKRRRTFYLKCETAQKRNGCWVQPTRKSLLPWWLPR